MALPLKDTTPKALPCVKCRAPSECEIWFHPVCNRCAADWMVKADATPELGGTGDKSAAYKAFTAAWLAEARRGVA